MVDISYLKTGIKSISVDTIAYGLAGSMANLIALISFPFLANHFTVTQFGQLDFFFTLFSLILTLLISGQDSAIFRFFNEESTKNNKAKLISKSILLQILCTLILILIIYLAFVINIFDISQTNTLLPFLFPLMISLPFGVIYSNTQAILRVTFRKRGYIFISLLFAFSNLVVATLCTQVIKADLSTFLFLYTSMWIFVGLISLWLIKKWLVFPKNFMPSNEFLKYAIPMGLVTLIGSFHPFIERFYVLHLFDTFTLGLFAGAAKISMIMTLPIIAFQSAFGPYVMANFRNQNAIELYNLTLKFFLVCVCVISLFLAEFGESILILLAGQKFYEGYVIIFPLTIAALFQATGLFLGVGTILTKNTTYRLLISIFSTLVSLILMYLLGLKYGIIGLSIGILGGKLVILILEAIVGQILWPLKWSYYVIPVLFFPTFVFGLFLAYWETSTYIGISFFFSFTLSIFFIGWQLGTKNEKDVLIELLKSIFFK